MAKKIISILESAYRGTLEEQDDTIIWLHHAMKGAGGEFSLVLRGSTVNYLVPTQDASGLSFGEWKQTQAPKIHQDLQKLTEKGVTLYALREDIEDRGIDPHKIIPNIQLITATQLPALIENHDLVWHW